jgi:hypothetical protein
MTRRRIECGFMMLLVVGAHLACAATVNGTDLARARAAREFDCPPKHLVVTRLGWGSLDTEIYKVAGCGKVSTYACDEADETCLKESEYRHEE